VGDQSSGKSSVLEGLTGLPFPRDSGLCTRFPTQIVFKRSKTSNTEVSIMTAHGQDDSKVEAIASFGKLQLKALDQAIFSDILAKVSTTIYSTTFATLISSCTYTQASKCMGLPLPGQIRDADMESFSHNILKFELSGPEYEHFSVVDLPGLFRSNTSFSTSSFPSPFI
jgi:Sec7-like guanine-nucleotide exchange factor